ncbi:MAG: hypothetical protein R3242_03900 [Akkermansiaceae bacterium]|nr:hypothetical protein [Akkermansiaceae bacterium]
MSLGLIDLGLHAFVDTGKSEKRCGRVIDHSLHLLCNHAYVVILIS